MGDRADQLKLYVWEDVLKDHTSGIIFALAHDVEEARRLACAIEDWEKGIIASETATEPLVVTSPRAFRLWGGG